MLESCHRCRPPWKMGKPVTSEQVTSEEARKYPVGGSGMSSGDVVETETGERSPHWQTCP